MTTTTEPMPTIHEASLLANGRLVPALLQAVRDERMSAEGAHLAFAQAVPVVAARLGISSRAILIVTDGGELLYGPNGLTIAEECEQEVLEALEAPAEPTWEERVASPDSDAHAFRPLAGSSDCDVCDTPRDEHDVVWGAPEGTTPPAPEALLLQPYAVETADSIAERIHVGEWRLSDEKIDELIDEAVLLLGRPVLTVRDVTTLDAVQPALVVPTHDSDVVSFLDNDEPVWIHLGQAKAYATWPEAALVRRPAHRSELPADLGAHRAPVEPLTWREALTRIRETLSVCFGNGDRFRA